MKNQKTKGIKLMLFALLIGWTLVIFVLLFWRINSTEQETREIAYIQAKVAQGKDILYRRWNSNHGGVYVGVTEKTQPNLYLAHIPERDITTLSGQKLTLVNPAYMTRQVNEYEAEISEIRSHLTSLKPVNPKNAPDQWEQKSLEAFETGVKEATIIDAFDGEPYYRLIQPFFVEKTCLKCHEQQGYKENDILGGISISIPIKPLLTIEASSKKRTALIYGFIWVLGIGGVFFSFFKLDKSSKKQNDAEIALEKAYIEVEQKVVERTRELNDEIVGRKLLQETLTASDQYNRMLFDQSVIGLALTRMDGQLVDVNPAYANIIGRTIDETLKLTYWDITPEKYAEQEGQQLESLKKTGHYGPYEKEYIHKDGHLVPVRLQGQIIQRNGEKFIWSCVEDITERKRAEKALSESQFFFEQLFIQSSTSTQLLDSEGWCVKINPKLSELFGVQPQDIEGKKYNILQDGEIIRTGVINHLKRVFEKKQTVRWEVNFDIQHASETTGVKVSKPAKKWFQNLAYPIANAEGKLIYVIVQHEDITSRKQTELELQKLNEELEEKVKARTDELYKSQAALINLVEDLNEKTLELDKNAKLLETKNKELETFTYSVSHDLKAPLRGIDGYSRLLEELYSENLNNEGRNFIKTIREGTMQMNQLIEDLLAYSRLERSTLRPSSINSVEFINSILTFFKNDILKNNVSVELDICDCLIIADSDALTIAMRNIVENAIKFSGKLNAPKIKISLKENVSSWLLSVEDNGIGFDMKYHNRIFEIFQRLNLPEQFAGTGIGLAMVQKSVERMGGKVLAESQLGKGAKFYIEISKK